MTVLASRRQLRASLLRWALVTVPAVLLLGFISGSLAPSGPDNPWFAALEKPAIYPPPMWFGIIWSLLFVMQGLALALICAAWGARGRALALVLFGLQFALSLAWTPVFFGMRDMGLALIVILVLDVLAVVTTIAFWRIRRSAGLLMVPYVAWILFATLLNWQFLQLNPDPAAVPESGAVQRIAI
ncbi:tryptophan-rich sensory protein [Altererythrobacter sp. SALINAS58]|uniref:TspO/MBR family protein n=1 Tax=Alteripontixanthobacter muriae TaxID=2705546 RepID=UPI0015767A10|nr:TspO/MBR family protein [Alteripontixanthobacter muriae]NTZ42722.1 tryptophan-rich sensory protein [Alteripontixanthobacter muriae]